MSRSEKGLASVLQVAEDILPSGELKAHLSEKIRELLARRRPFVATQNAAVQEGLDDHAAGRVISHDEVGRRLDARFGTLTKHTKKK